MKDLVVIIILNYNQNKYTLDCIESVLSTEYKNFKIMLIDNGSTKENVQELTSLLPIKDNLIFIKIKDNRGYVGGMNFGLSEAAKLNPEYLMVMNNDTILDKLAVIELVKTCRSFDNKAVVTGKVYHYNEPDKLQLIGYTLRDKKFLKFDLIGTDEIDVGQFDEIEERDMIDDIFGLYPIDLYNSIGGYSPFFWFNGEQADLALRAKKEGYKLIYTPNAKLWHKGSVSIGGREMNPKLAYWTVQSTLILRYLHLNRIPFIYYYFKTIISIMRTFLKSIYVYVKSGKNMFKYSFAKYKGWIYFNKWVIKKNVNTGENPFL